MVFKVEDIRKTNDLAKTKSAKKIGGSENFADYLKTSIVSDEKQVQASSSITSADAIFAAQMVDTDEEKQIRRKLIKKGESLLQNLEDIRQSLLLGEIEKDKLIDISRLVKRKDIESSDPKLQEILQEIELRVEVELAKLMR